MTAAASTKSLTKKIQNHENSGRYFRAGGIKSFVLDQGNGEAVVCIHGVPSSSYLYRKLVPELAQNGFRGIAFDLPGLGLSQRPDDSFDFSWTGLGKWVIEAVETVLGSNNNKFHLIIHDIGGPIGMELVAAHPEKILSLTILNTFIKGLSTFHKPLVMKPFASATLGPMYLASLNAPLFKALMRIKGVKNVKEFSMEDARSYIQLIKREDNGKAFLKIMRSFEPTLEKERLYLSAIKALGDDIPKQVVFGKNDGDLKSYGKQLKEIPCIKRYFEVSGRHFLQEDCYEEIVAYFVDMIQEASVADR